MAIENSLEKLSGEFRTKAKVFLEVIRKRYPNVSPFETLRTTSRQMLLVAQGKSRTLKSKHLEGKAVDWVFMKGNQPTWAGDYYFLQWIATMCGMARIKQELCHTQDNGVSIADQMANNSKRYNNTIDRGEMQRLHDVNECFRKYS